MVSQMATTALLLIHFSDSPHLGGVAVVVWGLMPFGVWRWSWHQVGRTVAGSAPMACVVCGRRGGAGGLRGALSSAVGFAPRLKCIWHKHIN
jgi:hypothetical protein